jgi:hypothetical protein
MKQHGYKPEQYMEVIGDRDKMLDIAAYIMFGKADNAANMAKRLGKNQVVPFSMSYD